MKSYRTGLLMIASMVVCGCVSTPSTKALITPIGAAGIYSFAPTERQSPDEMKAARETQTRLARMTRDDEQQQAQP